MKKILETNQGQNMIHVLMLGGYLILLITAGSGFFIKFKNPRITNFNQRIVNSNYFFLKILPQRTTCVS